MTIRTIITGASTLTVGRVLSQMLALVRHVIVGRLLSPGDLGVAALLMVTSALLDLATQFSVDKLLVQAKDGDEPRLQSNAQLFLALRGLLIGVAALALCVPLAGFFRVPEAAWAFAAFGAVPILGGLRHLDCKRAHRGGRFAADMSVEVVPQALVAAAAWPMIAWIGGYAGVVWLLVLKAALSVGMSHVVAGRRYGWDWDLRELRRIIRFGWPLLLGSVLLFVITQGDQLLVGWAYSLETLGYFAVAASITLAVVTMISSISSTLLLPILAARAADHGEFGRAHAISTLVHAIVAALTGAACIVLGPVTVTFLYGDRYAAAGDLIGLLGILHAVRLMRVSPSVACVARADTLGPLLANVFRVSVLPLAIWIAWSGMALPWVIMIGVLGEIVALLALSVRVRRAHAIDAAPVVAATVAVLCLLGLVKSGTATLGVMPGAMAALVAIVGLGALVYVARRRWARPIAAFRWIPAGPGVVLTREGSP